MPTGYTADVQNGKITEFKDFALQCARAFGALITMRDDPIDAEIPDEIEPDSYYGDQLRETSLELVALEQMTEKEIAASADQQNRDRIARYKERIQEKSEQRQRLKASL